MQIQGVPEAITRDLYVQIIETLGLDPSLVIEMTFRSGTITAEVVALDEEGRPYPSPAALGAARHIVTIPIVDDPAAA